MTHTHKTFASYFHEFLKRKLFNILSLSKNIIPQRARKSVKRDVCGLGNLSRPNRTELRIEYVIVMHYGF